MNDADAADHAAWNDPRVWMAAERTLLAWVRTGLAMMGFGFVVARYGLFLHEIAAVRGAAPPGSGHSLWIGATLVLLGVVVNLLAAVQHVRFLRKIPLEESQRPSAWSLGVVVTLVLAALGLAMASYLVVEGVQ
jgi:inner membrane protein YidH